VPQQTMCEVSIECFAGKVGCWMIASYAHCIMVVHATRLN
jgi:hypothetical protein